MIKFLIHRPIGVGMFILSFFSLGLISFQNSPLSLLPDIVVPQITLKAYYPDHSAREIENLIVKPLRRQLLQLHKIKDLQTLSRNGSATIKLFFSYGTNTEYAFIEANEKIDISMNKLPQDMARPIVVKSKASDIASMNINLSLKASSGPMSDSSKELIPPNFLDLSTYTEKVIQRRLEQLPEVAMVDVSGLIKPEVSINLDKEKLKAYGVSADNIQNKISSYGIEFGSLLLTEGQYTSHLRFVPLINSLEELKTLEFISQSNLAESENSHKNLRIVRMKDIAEISLHPESPKGLILSNGELGISLAIIKRNDAKSSELERKLYELLKELSKNNPQIDFQVSRNQLHLLKNSINNLSETLLLGVAMACLVLVFFLKRMLPSLLIICCVPISIVISFLLMWGFGISINIISLSGMILAAGLMIDNSIIVIDNIVQFQERGSSIQKACVKGTQEVMSPLLSSNLTTASIFIPLTFLSDITGALFWDQALTVCIGLGISYLISISLIPTFFFLINKRKIRDKELEKDRLGYIFQVYEKAFDWVLERKILVVFLFILCIPIGFLFFNQLEQSQFPQIEQTELELLLKWEQNLSIEENANRLNQMFSVLSKSFEIEWDAQLGEQQFLLDEGEELGLHEANLHLSLSSSTRVEEIKSAIQKYLGNSYPEADFFFNPPKNIFEKLFPDRENILLAKISSENESILLPNILVSLTEEVEKFFHLVPLNTLKEYTYLSLKINRENLLIYDVSYENLLQQLKTAFGKNNFTNLKLSGTEFPIIIKIEDQSFEKVKQNLLIQNNNGNQIPLHILAKIQKDKDFNLIYGGKEGEFIPLIYHLDSKNSEGLKDFIINEIVKYPSVHVSISDTLSKNQKLIRELIFILFASTLLLYFILSIQFEALLLPIIILLEIPIVMSGSLAVLYFFGESLNLISATGMIVVCGIIINDSILKIDTINRLRKSGLSIDFAIKKGSQDRFRPIVMTSLTTILALLPLLFGSGFGADLSRPFAFTVMAGMLLGTVSSLFLLPLLYHFMYTKKTS